MKFNLKLLLVFLSIFILAFVSFGMIQYRNSAEYMMSLELQNLTEKSILIRDQLDDYLEKAANIVEIISMNSEVLDFARSGRYEDKEQIHRLLNSIRDSSSEEYSIIYILDKTGVCRASTDRWLLEHDYSFQQYYAEAIDKRRNVYISDYAIGLSSLVPGVYISAPLEYEDESLAGVLVLKIAGQYLQDRIEYLNNPGHTDLPVEAVGTGLKKIEPLNTHSRKPQIFIINRDGIILMHPDLEYIYRSIMPLPQEAVERLRKNRQFLGHDIQSINDPVLGELHQKTLNSYSLSATMYRENEKWSVLAMAPMAHNGWSIGVTFGYEDISFLSQALLTETIILFGLILILIITTSLYVTRKITHPIKSLVDVVSGAREGNWNTRVPVKGRDEFSYMAERFNELLDIISSYSRDMESKVEIRTRELVTLQKENTRLRIVEERNRLYADMHDSVGACITNINICNNVAQSKISSDPATAESMLRRIETNCDTAIEDMKGILAREDRMIDEESVLGDVMLKRFSNRLSLRGIAFRSSVTDISDLLNDKQSHQIRGVLEEMVSNSLKHSKAESVFIKTETAGEEIRIHFEDDGCGMSEDSLEKGYGRRNIKRRLNRINSQLTVYSEADKGVHYTITIPLHETEE